jgi:hypothetical protein
MNFTKDTPATIATMFDGEVSQMADKLIEEAIKNCLALDYDQSTREIQICLKFTPNDRRSEVFCIPEFKIKKGKLRFVGRPMAVGINSQGKGEAREFVDRQQLLFNQGVTPITSAKGE